MDGGFHPWRRSVAAHRSSARGTFIFIVANKLESNIQNIKRNARQSCGNLKQFRNPQIYHEIIAFKSRDTIYSRTQAKREPVMGENRAEGFARNVGGKMQDAVGGFTGDPSEQIRGKANQAMGQAQTIYGRVINDVEEFVVERPVVALLAAVGLGIIFSFALRRR